jgi:hypothetical protein
MSAESTRRSVGEILAAVKAALVAAQWTPPDSDPTAAFQDVKLFDVADLVAAFEELMASKQRVAFIIADSEQFQTATDGLKVIMTRRQPVAILISDRVIGNRVTALYGDLTANPPVLGAEGLKEIALAAITGELIAAADGMEAVHCTPIESEAGRSEDVKKKTPGRSYVELDMICTGGTLEADLTSVPM